MHVKMGISTFKFSTLGIFNVTLSRKPLKICWLVPEIQTVEVKKQQQEQQQPKKNPFH